MTPQTLAERLGDFANLCEDSRPVGVWPGTKAVALLREAAAALEAAREDACVALVADIRFACGDNGKRMQPELVEFIRGLAVDAERYRWLRSLDGACDAAACVNFNIGFDWIEQHGAELDAAIDQARGKGVAE